MKNKKNNSWYRRQSIARNNDLNELVDFVDDDTAEEASQVMSPEIVNLDELERQKAQTMALEQGEPTSITEEEVGDYFVDDLVEQDEQEIANNIEEGYFDGSYVPSEEELQEQGIETVVDTGEEVDEEAEAEADAVNADPLSKLREAWQTNRVVKLSYLTLGKKRGRGGSRYILKRELDQNDRIPGTGVNIWRIVEPHDIFTAKNGHEILITYDRSVRHIRAFRMENITDVEFCKKRGTDEPSYFKPGRKIKIKNPDKANDQSGKIKGIEAMNVNIFQNLKSVGDDLEKQGLSKTASVITATMSNLLNIKTAQYVGPQGYWIRQKRCWDNCYRQKRTTSPKKAAQVVWTECWEEYNKSINNNSSGWEKYAADDTELFKYASEKQKNWVDSENKKFASSVEEKVASGKEQGMAIYLTLEEKKDEYNSMLLVDADNLSKLAEKLKDNGQEELSEKIANISSDILKEAQFGGGFEGIWNKVRKFNPFSGKSRQKGISGDIRTRLKRVTQKALQLAQKFNEIQLQARQYGQDWDQEQQSAQAYQQQQQAKQQKRQDAWNATKNWGKNKAQQVGNAVGNAANQVGNAFMNNPVGQGLAGALSESNSDVKTSQTMNPANVQQGANEFLRDLREELQEFLGQIGKESSAMAQMATTAEDTQSQQRASQASKRLNQLVQKSNEYMQAFNDKTQMSIMSSELATDLQNFANDLSMIQTGNYTEEVPPVGDDVYADPGADPDGDNVPNVQDPDRNNDSKIDNPEASVPATDPAGEAIAQKVQSGQRISREELKQYTASYYLPKLRAMEAEMQKVNDLPEQKENLVEEYQSAKQLAVL
jgi:hypothetical protein